MSQTLTFLVITAFLAGGSIRAECTKRRASATVIQVEFPGCDNFDSKKVTLVLYNPDLPVGGKEVQASKQGNYWEVKLPESIHSIRVCDTKIVPRVANVRAY